MLSCTIELSSFVNIGWRAPKPSEEPTGALNSEEVDDDYEDIFVSSQNKPDHDNALPVPAYGPVSFTFDDWCRWEREEHRGDEPSWPGLFSPIRESPQTLEFSGGGDEVPPHKWFLHRLWLLDKAGVKTWIWDPEPSVFTARKYRKQTSFSEQKTLHTCTLPSPGGGGGVPD